MAEKWIRPRKRGLTQQEIEVLMALPSDSEDDMCDDDSDIDPDYIPEKDYQRDGSDFDIFCMQKQTDTPIPGNTAEPINVGASTSAELIETESSSNFIPNILVSPTNSKSHTKKSISRDMRWKANKDNDYAGNAPCFEPPEEITYIGTTPMDYFYALIPENYLEEICYQSNLYATQSGKENLNLSVQELKIFLGMNLVMTYIHYARVRQYWSTVGDLRLGIIADSMSLNRFEIIKRFLHFHDNSNVPSNNTDRLIKLRPFLDLLHKTFHEARQPEECHSVDEMMVPFKGRSTIKQYIKSKPKPWGFKIWVRAGVSGYVYCFEIFQGAQGGRNPPSSEFGAAGDVVLRLCHDISGKNHKVFCDNYFTSIPLIDKLKDEKIYVVGTIRQNRIKDADKKLKCSKVLLKEGRGSVSVTTSENNITVTRWVDRSVVHVISSFAGVEPMDKAKRFCGVTKSVIDIGRPHAVKMYNTHMGGVDLMDSLVGLYPHKQRNIRWYMRIFFHLLNVTVNNAWLLWRKDNHESMDLLEFKSSIASNLIYSGRASSTSKKGRPQNNSPVSSFQHKKRKIFTVSNELRYDGGKHYPKKSDGKFALKCKNVNCSSKTRYMCNRCSVYLCPECFETFHEH